MQQWAVLRFVTTFGNSRGLKGVGGLLMRDAIPSYTDYYFFVWRRGRNGSHIHLSHPPPPSPSFATPLSPNDPATKLMVLSIFMIWNDLWEKFWPSLKTINVNVVNVVLRVTLFFIWSKKCSPFTTFWFAVQLFFKERNHTLTQPPLVHTH